MTLQPRSNFTGDKYRQQLPAGQRLIVVDLETTGLSPYTERIIEIGALELIDFRKARTFNTLTQPSRVLPEKITQLTGIAPGDLEGKPPPSEALKQFIAWIGPQEEVTFIGHNIAFDMSFLECELGRVNREQGEGLALPRSTFCTYNFIKSAFFGRQLDLDRACRLFAGQREKAKDRHRALADCELTQKLLIALFNWTIFIDSPGLPIAAMEEDPTDSPPQPTERKLPWGNHN